MSTTNAHADGTNTIFEPVIESLRSFLESNPIIGKSRGGAIIFFTKKEHGNLKVRVFPLKKDSALFVEAPDVLPAWQIDRILERINAEKQYHLFSHYDSFKQDNMSGEHFTTKVADANVVNYSKDYIEYNGRRFTWTEFFKEFENGNVDKNTYEQLLFEPGCKEISCIPLPVLSTPFILLVLNHTEEVKSNLHELLRVLYFRSRDTVSKYLYSRLIDNLMAFLLRDGYEISEEELVEKFILELCNILLPISYCINGGEEKLYYDEWPAGDEGSEYELHLLGGVERSYSVVFKLTTFVYTDLIDVDSERWTKFHESVLFKANKKQSSFLIAKLFMLLFEYWRSLKTAKEAARLKLAETLDTTNLNGKLNDLIEVAQQLKRKLDNVEVEINRRGLGPMNKLTIVPVFEEHKLDEITLVVGGTKLIEPRDIGGKNQVTGFKYLRYILEQSKKANYNFSIAAQELLDPSYGSPESDPDIADVVSEQEEDFRIRYEGLSESVSSFVDQHEELIDACLSTKVKSPKKGFDDGFYYYAAIHKKLKKIPVYRAKNVKNKKLEALMDLYIELDQKKGSVETIIGVKKATATIEEGKDLGGSKGNYDPNNGVEHIRICFRAILKKIRDEGQRPEKKKAAVLLLDNLVAAGLINKDKREPQSQSLYNYNQKTIQPFIDWEF